MNNTARRAALGAAAVVLVAVVGVTVLGGGSNAGGAGTDAATASPTHAAVRPGESVLTIGGIEVGYIAPEDYDVFTATGRDEPSNGAHWEPPNMGAAWGERWGEWYLFAATIVFDPGAQSGSVRTALPADPVAWLRNHPDITVLEERQIEVDGRRAYQLDVKQSSSYSLFGWEEAPMPGEGSHVAVWPFGGGEYQRFVFWQVDPTWMIAQARLASQFGHKITQADTSDDPFVKFLADLRFD